MVCKRCGTNFDSPFCPNCGKPANPQAVSIFKKWWFWVIVALAIFLLIPTGNPKEPDIQNNNTTPTQIVSPNQDTKPKYHVGDTVSANGLKITYISAEKWESPNQYDQPDAGYMYMRMKICIENVSSADRDIFIHQFECYADNKKESQFYSPYANDRLETETISSGRKMEGYLYFAVPEAAENIEVEYEINYLSGQRVILVVDLA